MVSDCVGNASDFSRSVDFQVSQQLMDEVFCCHLHCNLTRPSLCLYTLFTLWHFLLFNSTVLCGCVLQKLPFHPDWKCPCVILGKIIYVIDVMALSITQKICFLHPGCSHYPAAHSDLAPIMLVTCIFGSQHETHSRTTAILHGLKIFRSSTQFIQLRFLGILSLCWNNLKLKSNHILNWLV